VPGSLPRKRRLEPLDAQQEALHSRQRHASPCCLFNSAGMHARDELRESDLRAAPVITQALSSSFR